MFSVISVVFLIFGVGFILFSIVHRWILMNWYLGMSESSWFFWGWSVPYIESREGRREFIKYQSTVVFVFGFACMVVGGVLIPFSYDIQFLMFLVWLVLMFGAMMSLRAHFIDVASEINHKHWVAQKRLMHTGIKSVCRKCGREIREDLRICPDCGELLFE